VPHFHSLILGRDLAVSSIAARLRASIEFTVIPTGAKYTQMRNERVGTLLRSRAAMTGELNT
jgi:hypothetical protein